jgi:hypothetical protein
VVSFISANKGARPCYEEDTVAPRFGETLVQRLRRLDGGLQLEARQFDLFHPRAREPYWLLPPKEACGTGVNLMARILRERVLRNRRTEALGGSRDY